MYCRLTTQEKLKDLRVARHLTLQQLEEVTGIGHSTLQQYENNDYKDITSHSLEVLSKFYGVSVDYLLGITENSSEANTPLSRLHLTDDAVAVLSSGKINTRLLSEIISHPGFRRFMIDSEIYVDRIAESRVRDMNATLEAVRQFMITERNADPDDLYMSTIKAAQLSEADFFGAAINRDLMDILSSVRKEHAVDSTTADTTGAEIIKEALATAVNFEGSKEERLVAGYLQSLGISYKKLTKEELAVFMQIMRKSDLLKPGANMRGKLGHGKGKRKK